MKNIYWREIPTDARVVDLGPSFVVVLSDGTRGGAYWTGEEAAQAQHWLQKRADKDAENLEIAIRRDKYYRSLAARKGWVTRRKNMAARDNRGFTPMRQSCLL